MSKDDTHTEPTNIVTDKTPEQTQAERGTAINDRIGQFQEMHSVLVNDVLQAVRKLTDHVNSLK